MDFNDSVVNLKSVMERCHMSLIKYLKSMVNLKIQLAFKSVINQTKLHSTQFNYPY